MDRTAGQRLEWEACYNARDLGGYPTHDGTATAWGSMLRADNLRRLTPGGRKAVERDGVRTVIDLRSGYEHAIDPCPFASTGRHESLRAGPAYLSVPVLDEADQAAAETLARAPTVAAMYALILDGCARRMAAVFAAVAAAPEGGVLVYCHAGKDRTGLVAALALAVASVPAEAIAEDYALSDRYLQPLYDAQLRAAEDPAQRRQLEQRLRSPLNAAEPETMRATLVLLDDRYGGAAEYLCAAGLTRHDLGRVRTRLRQ